MNRKIIETRGLKIGEGSPKICASIIERNQDDILEMAENLCIKAVDMVEWRLDFYEDVDNIDEVCKTASLISSILRNKPLLATFRTKKEGGEREISPENYERLLVGTAASAAVDMVDVESYFFEREKAVSIIERLKKECIVVGSYHDFNSTPCEKEIVDRLLYMAEIGADIPKIAVMPEKEKDLFTLMSASRDAADRLEQPVVTMSMGSIGALSRFAGARTGSAVTFGCLGEPSAPGQINVNELRDIMDKFDLLS